MKELVRYENIEERFLWEDLISKNPSYHSSLEIKGVLSIEVFHDLPKIQRFEEVIVQKDYPFSRIVFLKNQALLAFMILHSLTRTLNYADDNYKVYLNKKQLLTADLEQFPQIAQNITDNNILTIRHLTEEFYIIFCHNLLIPITIDNEKNYTLLREKLFQRH